MINHKIKYILVYFFLLVFGVLLYFIQDIRIKNFVIIESVSYTLGIIYFSCSLFFTKKSIINNDKSIWNTLLFFSSPIIISFLFSNTTGSNLLIREIPEGMSTSSMNFLVSLIFIPLITIFLYLFRKDNSFVKRIVLVSTLYISALTNRAILYHIDGIFKGVLSIEIISITSTIILYLYIDFINKNNCF